MGWNPPRRPRLAEAADDLARSRALSAVQGEIRELPSIVASRRPHNPGPLDAGLEVQSFLAAAQVLRAVAVTVPVGGAGAPGASIRLDAATGGSLSLTRPDETSAAVKDPTVARIAGRAAKLDEIVAQQFDPDVFMLDAMGFEAEQHPAVYALARAALTASNLLCFELKDRFRVRRPNAATDGRVRPAVETPPHTSYPGGHASQAAAVAVVVSRLLDVALGDSGEKKDRNAITRLAWRIADNRVTAGLHYEVDTDGGFELGWLIGEVIASLRSQGNSAIGALWSAAAGEL